MNFEKVAQKIENILNGVDSEVNGLELTEINPTDFYYEVNTVGFHLDHIMNTKKGTNFIPVFISSMGGNLNPVPDLKQGNYNVPIVFYFPVRFKEEMFKLYDYLVAVFCGRILNYGDSDNVVRCVSNVSVPSFGEIQGLDLKEFITWVENRYQEQIRDVNQPFFSMQVNLYLSNAADGFVYGNDVSISLTIDGESEIEAETLVFAGGAIQSASQAQSEQVIGETETEGLPTATTTGFSVAAYYKDDDFYHAIIDKWFDGELQTLRFDATITLGDYTYSRYAFVESVNMPIRKGELLTITFSFTKAIDFRPPVETTTTTPTETTEEENNG